MKSKVKEETGHPDTGRWTLDDNYKVQHLGWGLFGDPLDLVSLRRGVSSQQIFDYEIKTKLMQGGPETKAYVMLIGSKLKHPNHGFRFDGSINENKRAVRDCGRPFETK